MAEETQQHLTPMPWPPEGYVPGQYAEWYCHAQENGQEEIYGPDELGEDYLGAVEQLIEGVNKADAAARIWEVLQAWEQRLFRRGYQFLTAGWKGWGMFGGSSGTTGASILQTQNAMKLFSCNVFGARHKKIVSLLSREVPGMLIGPESSGDPVDEAAAEEAEKYHKVYLHQGCIKQCVERTASYFYTDDRVGALTYTVADQTLWGTEAPPREQAAYGAPESEGVLPETEGQQAPESNDQPARREQTYIHGKLETKAPLLADSETEMGWIRFSKERSANKLRAKYPWIRKKIATQGSVGGMDQLDRMARINCRLAVQSSSSSGESGKSDATEMVTFFRPSEYEGIEDEDIRGVFYATFPDGLEVWHAGGQLAFVRNAAMSDHAKIVHATEGDGQNRESIGANYMPLQKILNANISLLDRYFRSAVPRRFALEPYIDTAALNTQSNDPAKVTPVTGLEDKALRIQDITGLESTPQPNTAMVEFIQWLIAGAPEAMDGASPAVFGMNDGEEGTFGEARLNRDQALQVFSMPWGAICELVEATSLQAVQSAARNRVTNISASLPGQQKLEIEIGKLKGSVLIQRESSEIPKTLAEQEQQIAQLLEQSKNVALYGQIMSDPENLAVFAKFPSLASLKVPGADAVEQQQGEFELLMRSGPVDNPAFTALQEQLQKGQEEVVKLTEAAQLDPTGQVAQQLQQTQQMLAQLQQAGQSVPPKVSTVPVAQDNSENHTVHAVVTLGMMTSPTGRKLKYGNDEQKAAYENLHLHWQEHVQVLKTLTPPPQVEMKATVSVDPSKLPPAAQSKAFEALGLQVSPEELTPQDDTHEVKQEKEGVDAAGIPTKTTISYAGKPLQ